MKNHIGLAREINGLRQLGDEFSALAETLDALPARPGNGLLPPLTRHIARAHELTGSALGLLSALAESPYAAVPGSRPALEGLASAAENSSAAAYCLAIAVAENPLDTAGVPGAPPRDDPATRHARHSTAGPVIATRLADAVEHLGLTATMCAGVASTIARDLTNHHDRDDLAPPLPRLTPGQYAALEKIAQGGAERFFVLHHGVRARAGDGTAIRPKPFDVLLQHRLIHIDTSTSTFIGQRITVTTAGEHALRSRRSRPAPAPAAATATQGGSKRL